MNLKNCKICGKLYNKVSKDMCPDCVNKEEEDFLAVKQYLDEHPNATVPQVAEDTEVLEKRINQFIREGRLQTTKMTNISAPCMRCGDPVKEGKYCKKCSSELEEGFKSVKGDKDKDDKKKGLGFHTKDRFSDK